MARTLAAKPPAARKPTVKPKASAVIYAETEGVRITSPGLEDTPERETILRGSVALESLPLLKIDKYYQRELLSNSSNRQIQRAIDMGVDLPDISLGMRGSRFTADPTGAVILLDPVYIIDGQQRVGTIIRHLGQFPTDTVRIGAQIYFDTTVERERIKFMALNMFRTNVSTNVMLANLRHESDLLASLFGLVTTQAGFVMYQRVCWAQQRKGAHLISASMYMNVAMMLHSHMAATRSLTARTIKMSLDNLQRAVSIQVVRDNTKRFWEIIDEAWGIEELSDSAVPYLKTGFLLTLARLFSDHVDFWDGEHLAVPLELRKRLQAFSPHNPAHAHLASGHGAALVNLRFLMIEHLNKRRGKKLTLRRPAPIQAAA